MQTKFNIDAEKNLDILSKGAFLTAQDGVIFNTMTISWGAIGIMWGKPVFVALVRGSRFTHGIIEKSNEFTVSLPAEDMRKELDFCGRASGRDVTKFQAMSMNTVPSAKIQTPRIDCKGAHHECKVLFKTDMSPANLDLEVKKEWYKTDDYHTFYFAEIVNTEVV